MTKGIKEYVLNNDNDFLFKQGLNLYNNKLKDVQIGSEGVCDIVCWERCKNKHIHIQLLKINENEVLIETLQYVLRMVIFIKHYLNKRCPNLKYTLEIMIIGKQLEGSLFSDLSEFLGINNPEFKHIKAYYTKKMCDNYFFSESFTNVRISESYSVNPYKEWLNNQFFIKRNRWTK